MRWRDMRRSDNVEDRRGMSMGGAGIKLGGGGLLLIVVLSLLTGTNPLDLLSGLEEAGSPTTIDSGAERKPPADDPQADFIRAILGDSEDTWGRLFSQGGGTYEPPRLVLFSGAVQSACGQASAAVGPFYCPPDRSVYLDLQFFQELSERFGAPGDFARAYVVAHEIGHHVQNLLGVSERVQRQRSPAGPGGCQRALGTARAPGGLLRRGLGPLRRAAQHPRTRRRRGRPGRGNGDRRRSPAEAVARVRRARVVHPWLVRAARPVVPDRSRDGGRTALRHVRSPAVAGAARPAADFLRELARP